MNRDVMEAHLTVLGWRPVKWKPWAGYRGWVYGVRSETQCCGQANRGLEVTAFHKSMPCEDIEWWLIRDDVLHQIAHTVDSAGMGGWDGE